jgi:3'-5' exoribonuclease
MSDHTSLKGTEMNKKDAESKIEDLCNLAHTLHVYDLVKEILHRPDFLHASGSGSPRSHHYGTHGLVYHTHEVVRSAHEMAKFYSSRNIDRAELFLSGVFHDTGKIYDYAETINTDGVLAWGKTEHYRNIHHISRSVIIWNEHSNKSRISTRSCNLQDRVTHNILSHHGLREWGSPVAPNSRCAWLLHLCDNMSARMYDCETLDLENRRK